MTVPLIFKTIEESGISTWIRDSPSFFAFWFILSFHAIGMGLLVGASVVIDLRILGVAKDLPIAPLKSLYRVIWLGFFIQIISGTLLLIGYPTKAFTNPDFYIKMTLVGLGVTVMHLLNKRVFSDSSLSDSDMMIKGKTLATWSLVLWAGAVTAGRLLAYTYNYLKYDYRG
ncbi:MAG TPA: hypothetical protein VFU37_23520 [Pyrinomonadaceae bacterium]|nr:hypothetical protein [Pyrinomonadaceae bacterium]